MTVQPKPLAHGALDVVAAVGAFGHLLADHQTETGVGQTVRAGIHLEQLVAARVAQMKNG
ncbi:hypothetical protein D3C78_1312750 [compost metagenome]